MYIYSRQEIEAYFDQLDQLWADAGSMRQFVNQRNELKKSWPQIGKAKLFKAIRLERLEPYRVEGLKSYRG